jgi:hypothetical protein
MDVDWAVNQLREYLRLTERVRLPEAEQTPNRKTRQFGTADEVRDARHVVFAIADAVYDEPTRYMDRDRVHRLIWELEHGDEVRDRLGIEPAPAFTADTLHPWVWSAAQPHWISGNVDAAVWAAAVNVNSRLQGKLARHDLGEVKLLNDAFSVDPPKPGHPRLRLVDDSNPDLFRDVHTGAAALGRGLYSAVRNPLNHVVADVHQIGDGEAMEALAGFSLLSRWIDRAEVVTS